MLEHIIGGAGLQGLDCRLLAQGPGDEDEGQVGAALAGIGEGGEAIIGGQGIVREDEGKAARFQRRPRTRPGVPTRVNSQAMPASSQERLVPVPRPQRCPPDAARARRSSRSSRQSSAAVSLRRRTLVQHRPEVPEPSDGLDELREVHGFDHVGIDAERVALD